MVTRTHLAPGPAFGSAARQSQLPMAPRAKLLIVASLLLVARLTIFVRRRPGDGSDFLAVDGFALAQMGLVGATCLLVIVTPNLSRLLRSLKGSSVQLLLGYYLFCAISTLWSPLPTFTLYRAIEYLSQILAILVAFSYFSQQSDVERKTLLFATVCMLMDFGMMINLNGGLPTSLRSVHTNTYSATGAMVLCYCLGAWLDGRSANRRVLVCYGGIALVFLLLGTSTASYISAVFGIIIAGVFTRRREIIFPAVLAVFAFIILLGTGPFVDAVFTGKTDRDIETISGRSFFWKNYHQLFLASPIWGNGYAVSARLSSAYATNTHNGLLAAALGTGVIGLVIVSGAAIRLAREIWTGIRYRMPGSLGIASASSAGVLNAMSVSYLGEVWMAPSFTFVCFMALNASMHYRMPGHGDGR